MSQNATSYKEPTPRQLRRQEWQAKRTAELAEVYRKRVARLSEAVPRALQRTNHRGVIYAYDEQYLRIFVAIETGTPLNYQPGTQRLLADAITQAIDTGLICVLRNKNDGLIAYYLPVDELLGLPGPERKFIATTPKEIPPIEWTVLLASGTFVTNHQGVAEQYLHGAPSRKKVPQTGSNTHLRVRLGLPSSLVTEWFS